MLYGRSKKDYIDGLDTNLELNIGPYKVYIFGKYKCLVFVAGGGGLGTGSPVTGSRSVSPDSRVGKQPGSRGGSP